VKFWRARQWLCLFGIHEWQYSNWGGHLYLPETRRCRRCRKRQDKCYNGFASAHDLPWTDTNEF
jgi:hypothetical protein